MENVTWGIYKKEPEKTFEINLDRYNIPTLKQQREKKKRGGIRDEKTEQRDLIAKLLKKPIVQIAGLTKDWTAQEMYITRRKAESFTKNPPALLWKLIKEINNEKKRVRDNNKQKSIKDVPRMGQKRGRKNESKIGERTLF